jgi:transposase
LRGHPRKRCRWLAAGYWLLAAKGYDAEALRQYCDRYRMQPVIPLRSIKREPKLGLARLFDRPEYRQRNITERMFGWLKENRRIVTRFEKLVKVLLPWSRWAVPCGVYDNTFRTKPNLLIFRRGMAAGNTSVGFTPDNRHPRARNINQDAPRLTVASGHKKNRPLTSFVPSCGPLAFK